MRNLISQTSIDFMSKQKLAIMLSGALLVIAVLAILIRGLNLGVDFTGGYTIELGYDSAPDLEQIRQTIVDAQMPEAQVQTFGSSSDILIRMAPREGLTNANLSTELVNALKPTTSGEIDVRRVEFVGPQVGEELREKGGLAILFALAGIIIYIWFRFEKKFSVGSVLALVHDVVITIGVFALFQIEFDLTILAAILAVIGYSLNDTIVVFDRIRENFRTMRRGTPLEVMNTSINQTLSRTVITSLTTLLVLSSLFIFGGKIINGFSLALIIGVIVGTYSSIFVASMAVLALGITKEDLMPVEKEGADLEGDLP
ncbi:MAG: protein translocase subunit SecF [Gammaproteobacteria bacterium]|nr:protein translocase subunit SecF [Gammaproteobacteria bacterium]